MAGFIFSSATITTNGFLLKVNSNGDEEWFRTYGSLGDAQFKSVTQAADGGYFAVGSIYYNNDEIHDLYIVKTDSRGNVK